MYFHLKYTGFSQIETKGEFRSVIPVPFFFFNMKENLAPAVMHMHEDTTVMNESVFKNGIITLYAVERKKKEKLIKAQSKKQKKPLLRLFMHMETVTFQCKVSDS